MQFTDNPGGRFPLGCDTMVALSGATADGAVILAKNSDRAADESQPLIQTPRMKYNPGAALKCQYIEIPQVEETLAFIGSRPYWLWGLEHGMNECGVAIGNEAVFSKETLPETGLLGMDLVRLGLERGHTAKEALEVICALIEEFGQGGSGSEHYHMAYHNSFIIADPTEAYILETSYKRYAWKATGEVDSISNHIEMGDDWDGLSDDALDFAVSNGWWDASKGRLNFAAAYRSMDMVPACVSDERLRQSQKLLEEYHGKISPESMMRSLRDHYDSGTVFTPGIDPSDGKCYSICMHADPIGTTAASVVAHLRRNGRLTTYWASLGNPCCGVFVPLYLEGEVPVALTRAGAEFSEDSTWWLFKKLGELVAEDYAGRTPRVQEISSGLEETFLKESVNIEAEAEKLLSEEDSDQAHSLLSKFMSDNLDKVLSALEGLLTEFESK